MNTDSKGEIEELNLEEQEMISGGTEPEFGQNMGDILSSIPKWEDPH